MKIKLSKRAKVLLSMGGWLYISKEELDIVTGGLYYYMRRYNPLTNRLQTWNGVSWTKGDSGRIENFFKEGMHFYLDPGCTEKL